jgi:N-methylhydantoinase A
VRERIERGRNVTWQGGVDVGGTFTDLILVDPEAGRFCTAKVPSTTADQSLGMLDALERAGVPLPSLDALVHGTTVATNAVLERKGARCGLITTRGFRDVLELGRRTRPHAYGLIGTYEPLIPRELRLEVGERVSAEGEVLVPLSEADVIEAVEALRAENVEAVVVHFLHSYANQAHETRCAEIVRERWPNAYVSVGSELLREVREFERGTTAAINAYIQPLIARYVDRLMARLAGRGFARNLLVMQGNGGTLSGTMGASHAVQTVMSGPAAGAIAVSRIGTRAGFPNLIGCDMGGTSFDVALIRDGEPTLSVERDLAYGLPIRVPMIDIHTIGAGGGSIARVDASGILTVGPDSAGSTPGPICYGRGGTQPTVTDANVLLGRLDTRAIPGVDVQGLLPEVERAFERLGEPLGLDVTAAAAAVLTVANDQMAGAVRLVSIERGHDPRDFALFAFGGAGALHAVTLARELGIPTVLVPRFPGITSALGCVLADLRYDFAQSIDQPLRAVDCARIDAVFSEHLARGRKLVTQNRVPVKEIKAIFEADLLYRGQTHVLRIPVHSPGFDADEVLAAFVAAYRARFDIELPGMMAMLVSVRTAVIGVREGVNLEMLAPRGGQPARTPAMRRACFDGRWRDVPVHARDDLMPGTALVGPCIVEQSDATTLLEPDCSARVDALGNLIIALDPPPAPRSSH